MRFFQRVDPARFRSWTFFCPQLRLYYKDCSATPFSPESSPSAAGLLTTIGTAPSFTDRDHWAAGA